MAYGCSNELFYAKQSDVARSLSAFSRGHNYPSNGRLGPLGSSLGGGDFEPSLADSDILNVLCLTLIHWWSLLPYWASYLEVVLNGARYILLMFPLFLCVSSSWLYLLLLSVSFGTLFSGETSPDQRPNEASILLGWFIRFSANTRVEGEEQISGIPGWTQQPEFAEVSFSSAAFARVALSSEGIRREECAHPSLTPPSFLAHTVFVQSGLESCVSLEILESQRHLLAWHWLWDPNSPVSTLTALLQINPFFLCKIKFSCSNVYLQLLLVLPHGWRSTYWIYFK